MKKFFIIVFFLFSICIKAYSSENLYPINDKNGGGYINKNGEIILKQKYNFALRFNGNYAIIQAKNLKYGVIDKKGNIVIEPRYEDLKNLSENFVIYKKDGKFGYIDILKNAVSNASFEDIKEFKEGLAAAKKEDKWGFINKKGEFIIKPEYYDVASFSEGLAAVSNSKHTTSGYINKKGKTVITFTNNALEPKKFINGLAPAINKDEEACYYINKRGKTVIDNKKIYPIKIYCGDFYEGLNVFYIDDNENEITTGYINKNGKVKYSMLFSIPNGVSKGEFSVFENFSSNMAQYTIDYKTGYINKKFKMVIPAIYEFARDFIGDLAYVKFENKEGYINKKGKWVWQKEREGM